MLVTGGAGYIGSVVVHELLAQGEQVVVYDDLSTGHADVVPHGRLVVGDIADDAALSQAIEAHGATEVMHFAAKSLVGESVRDPLLYFDHNVGKTVRMLQTLRRHGARRLVFSSTAAVYGEPEYSPIGEQTPKNPLNPYGFSKWWIEQILDWCRRSWDLQSIKLRYFNAAGGWAEHGLRERHDPETHLIPRLLHSLRRGEGAAVFGNDYPTADGTPVRDYVHVRDLARAHVAALHALRGGTAGAYNVGSGRGYTVLQVIEAIARVSGRRLRYEIAPRRAGDPATLVADPSRIEREIGWHAEESSIDAIVASAISADEA